MWGPGADPNLASGTLVGRRYRIGSQCPRSIFCAARCCLNTMVLTPALPSQDHHNHPLPVRKLRTEVQCGIATCPRPSCQGKAQLGFEPSSLLHQSLHVPSPTLVSPQILHEC